MAKNRNAEKLAERREELADVKAAIKKILSGAQSYTIGSRSLTRANCRNYGNGKKNLKTKSPGFPVEAEGSKELWL
jgi:hypothetical protein